MLAALVVLGCTAGAAADSVGVNSAGLMTTTATVGKTEVDAKGINGDASKTNQHQAQHNKKAGESTTERERYDAILRIPFVKSDTSKCGKRQFELFFSGLYFGWGGTNAYGTLKNTPKFTREWGILNILGAACKFGDRNRLSLGIGYQHREYRLKRDFQFVTANEQGDVDIVTVPPAHEKPCATLHNYTIQFPLLYAKGFGKGFWAYVGGVMNWNCYADYDYDFRTGKTKHKETTHGLRQRKITFDLLTGLTWHGMGAYFRYSPQHVFASGAGPKLDKTWTMGITLGF